MEIERKREVKDKKTHHGRAIQRLRHDQRLSQAEMGMKVGMTQSVVSAYENKEEIVDEILMRFAKVLNVSVEFIKELEEDKPMYFYMENNPVSANSGNGNFIGNSGASHQVINQRDEDLSAALKQMQKLYEENSQLYAKTIQLYEQNIRFLQERLANLEKNVYQQPNQK